MKYFLITFAVLSLSIVAMAIGFIFAKKELKGSCGGLGNVIGEDCMFCGKKEECDSNPEHKAECVKLECTPDNKVELVVQH